LLAPADPLGHFVGFHLGDVEATRFDLAIAAARDVIARALDDRRRAALIDGAIAALGRQLH
jgi:F0F1-type ATP synthase membrane subunit b/b'